MATQPRFVVLEDHPLVRDALAGQLLAQFDDAVIVYSGQSVADSIVEIATHGADCIVLDLDLSDGRNPVANVLDLAETQIPILIVSALGDQATIRGTLVAGAMSFVSKQAESAEMMEAVKSTLAGEPFTSREVAAALLSSPATTSVALSDQERRAMVLYASGLKMRAVARRMGVTEGTAQEYIKRVRAKYMKAGTPVPTKTDMYRMARNEGLVP
ncbi:MAG: response regulator transcription factor [Actinomycetes bacterium]